MQGQLSPHRELQLLASYEISLMLNLEELEEIDLVSQHLEHGQSRLFRNHTQLDVDKTRNGIDFSWRWICSHNTVEEFSCLCISSNVRSFGCAIICTDTIHNATHFNNVWYTKTPSLIGKPYLAIIASNGHCMDWFKIIHNIFTQLSKLHMSSRFGVVRRFFRGFVITLYSLVLSKGLLSWTQL